MPRRVQAGQRVAATISLHASTCCNMELHHVGHVQQYIFDIYVHAPPTINFDAQHTYRMMRCLLL